MRKALQTEQGKNEMESRIQQLEADNKDLERQVGETSRHARFNASWNNFPTLPSYPWNTHTHTQTAGSALDSCPTLLACIHTRITSDLPILTPSAPRQHRLVVSMVHMSCPAGPGVEAQV